MSFKIIDGDIAQVNTDAVVLPANPKLLEGAGSSFAIFEAAGSDKLAAACAEIGYCPFGEAVITPGYNLKSKYIIHAVCPKYIDGEHREAELLYKSYQSSLELAIKNGIKSISFPLLSSGHYKYPRGQALDIANKAILEFLDGLDDDLEVQLVIYDKSTLHEESYIFEQVGRYIRRDLDRNDFDKKYLDTREFFGGVSEQSFDAEILKAPIENKLSLDDILKNKHKTFLDLLFDLINRSELSNPQIYHRAGITKQTFSKIISGQSVPKKNTIFALSIALELRLDEVEELLMKAGYAISDVETTDTIVKYFIENKKYNIMEVNEVLYFYNEPTL